MWMHYGFSRNYVVQYRYVHELIARFRKRIEGYEDMEAIWNCTKWIFKYCVEILEKNIGIVKLYILKWSNDMKRISG